MTYFYCQIMLCMTEIIIVCHKNDFRLVYFIYIYPFILVHQIYYVYLKT